jgi:hypothetical protein
MHNALRSTFVAMAAVLIAACGDDGAGGSAAGNAAPTIAGEPPRSIGVDDAYHFKPAVSNPSGDALVFSIEGKPAWLRFDASTGRLTGTPGDGDIGTYEGIVISVSDGATQTVLPEFSITVGVVDGTALSISGTPPSAALADDVYSFEPMAHDPDGDALTFSVVNLPDWAIFDERTGQISGTPGAEHVGHYGDIVIGVTDGTEEHALPAFDIQVHAFATGTATLAWMPPTEYEDGTSLAGELAGFKIYWGSGEYGRYTKSVTLHNPGLTSYVVENLLSGLHHFAVTAFTTAGIESVPSDGAVKLIP